MMSKKGYIKINRKIDDWEFRHDMTRLGFWIHLLLSAEWKGPERGTLTTSMNRLEKEIHLSKKNVALFLHELSDLKQIKMEDAGDQLTKIKILNYDKYQSGKVVTKCTTKESEVVTKCTTGGDEIHHLNDEVVTKCTTGGDEIHHLNEDPSLFNIKKEEYIDIEEYKNISISDTDDEKSAVEIVDREDAWFREFWKEYPKKVAKKDAHKAFMKACRNEQTFNEIMAGLEQSKEISWSRRDMKYIPNAATWLNGERWTDDLEDQRIRDPYLKSLMDELEKGDSNESEGSENHTDFDPLDVSWYRKQWNNS